MALTREQTDRIFNELIDEIQSLDLPESDFHAWIAQVMSFFAASIGLNHPFCINITNLYENFTGDQRNIFAVFKASYDYWKKGYLPLITELSIEETKQQLGKWLNAKAATKRKKED